MFDVQYQPASNLIQSTLTGFLSVDTVQRYATKIEPIIHRAAARPLGYTMLIDVAGCSIQSQAVVAAFQQHVASVPKSRRCAVVTGNSVIRMQIRRIIIGSTMTIFSDRAEAMQWLMQAAA